MSPDRSDARVSWQLLHSFGCLNGITQVSVRRGDGGPTDVVPEEGGPTNVVPEEAD